MPATVRGRLSPPRVWPPVGNNPPAVGPLVLPPAHRPTGHRPSAGPRPPPANGHRPATGHPHQRRPSREDGVLSSQTLSAGSTHIERGFDDDTAVMQTRSLKRGRVDTPASTANYVPTDVDTTEVEAVIKAMLEKAANADVAAKAKLAMAKCVRIAANAAMEVAEKDVDAKEKLATAASSKWEAAKVRYTTVVTFGKIDHAALTSLAGAIISMFKDPDRDVRKVAVNALGKLGQTVLASYAGAIIGMCRDGARNARQSCAYVLR